MPGPVNWERADLFLIRELHFRPWELDQMTLAEYALALSDPEKPRPPDGHLAMTAAEVAGYAAKVRGMTALERLEAAREGRL